MQRPTLTERMILAPPKEGAKYEVSLPPLEPESQGQHAPGTKDLVPVLGLRPQTSILRAGKAGEALFKAPEGHSPGPPITYLGHLDPVFHHSGPVPGHHAWVLESGGDHRGDQRVVLAYGGTDSGCPMLSSVLVLWGPDGAQALWGRTCLNSPQGERGVSLSPASPQLSVPNTLLGSN